MTAEEENKLLKEVLNKYADPENPYYVDKVKIVDGQKVYIMKTIIGISKLAKETLDKLETQENSMIEIIMHVVTQGSLNEKFPTVKANHVPRIGEIVKYLGRFFRVTDIKWDFDHGNRVVLYLDEYIR